MRASKVGYDCMDHFSLPLHACEECHKYDRLFLQSAKDVVVWNTHLYILVGLINYSILDLFSTRFLMPCTILILCICTFCSINIYV